MCSGGTTTYQHSNMGGKAINLQTGCITSQQCDHPRVTYEMTPHLTQLSTETRDPTGKMEGISADSKDRKSKGLPHKGCSIPPPKSVQPPQLIENGKH